MKISKRTREQAALICAVRASTTSCLAFEVCDAIGIGGAALEAACWTHNYVRALPRATFFAWAEAESLLRTGWTP